MSKKKLSLMLLMSTLVLAGCRTEFKENEADTASQVETSATSDTSALSEEEVKEAEEAEAQATKEEEQAMLKQIYAAYVMAEASLEEEDAEAESEQDRPEELDSQTADEDLEEEESSVEEASESGDGESTDQADQELEEDSNSNAVQDGEVGDDQAEAEELEHEEAEDSGLEEAEDSEEVEESPEVKSYAYWVDITGESGQETVGQVKYLTDENETQQVAEFALNHDREEITFLLNNRVFVDIDLAEIGQEDTDYLREDMSYFSHRAISNSPDRFANFTQDVFERYDYSFLDQDVGVDLSGSGQVLSDNRQPDAGYHAVVVDTAGNVYATSDDAVMKDYYRFNDPAPNAVWELHEIMTAELLTAYETEKITDKPEEILEVLLAYRPDLPQDLDQWTVREDDEAYFFHLNSQTDIQFYVRGHAAYEKNSQYNRFLSPIVIQLDLTQALLDQF